MGDQSKIKELVKQERARVQTKINKIPILAPLLGALGIVSVFYGLEKILDQSVLANQPLIMLAFGVLVLLLTGAFYEKL